MAPFTTLHAFLPLLTSQKSTLLFLTPSVPPSLSPACHATENVVAGGLQQYVSTLQKEIRTEGVNVVHFKLGQFDYGLAVEDDQQQLVLSQHASIVEATKQRLKVKGLVKEASRGTSLRELNNNIFDAIVREKGKNGTTFVGRGSRTYDLVGKWVPNTLLNLMMGAGKVEIKQTLPKKADSEGTSEHGWDNVGDRESDEEAYMNSKI